MRNAWEAAFRPIGFFHLDVAEVPCRIHTIAPAIRRRHARQRRAPLTGNGTQFVDRTPSNEEAEAAADACWAGRDEPRIWRVHAFAHACEQHGIEHRTTEPAHP